MKYLTAVELSKQWGISNRMIVMHCKNGRISGAIKKAKLWLIPIDAKKPIDKRKATSTVISVDENIVKQGALAVLNKVELDNANDGYYPGAIHKYLGLTSDTLLYYEAIGLIDPKRKIENSYREFDVEDMLRFMAIDFYKKRGFNLLEIKNRIKKSNHADSSAIMEKKLFELDQSISEQQNTRKRLQETKDFCEYAHAMDGKIEIRDFPLYSVLKSFDDRCDFSNYGENILRKLGKEDLFSNRVRAISFNTTGYTGSKWCIVKKVTGEDRPALVLESGKCMYTTRISSPENPNFEEEIFFALYKWANEHGVEPKGITYCIARYISLEKNNKRHFYEIWVPIK